MDPTLERLLLSLYDAPEDDTLAAITADRMEEVRCDLARFIRRGPAPQFSAPMTLNMGTFCRHICSSGGTPDRIDITPGCRLTHVYAELLREDGGPAVLNVHVVGMSMPTISLAVPRGAMVDWRPPGYAFINSFDGFTFRLTGDGPLRVSATMEDGAGFAAHFTLDSVAGGRRRQILTLFPGLEHRLALTPG